MSRRIHTSRTVWRIREFGWTHCLFYISNSVHIDIRQFCQSTFYNIYYILCDMSDMRQIMNEITHWWNIALINIYIYIAPWAKPIDGGGCFIHSVTYDASCNHTDPPPSLARFKPPYNSHRAVFWNVLIYTSFFYYVVKSPNTYNTVIHCPLMHVPHFLDWPISFPSLRADHNRNARRLITPA